MVLLIVPPLLPPLSLSLLYQHPLMLRVTMRMRLSTTKMMLRMKLKPRTMTFLVCCPIAKVYAAAGEAVEGGVGDVGEANRGLARSNVKFIQVGKRNAGASVSISKDPFQRVDSQILSFQFSAIP